MILEKKELLFLCDLAIEAAVAAGDLINIHKSESVAVKNKQSGTSKASQVVTEIDLLSQELIIKTLQESIVTYDLGLLTEESVDDRSRLHKDYFWCIDPMDGTLAFIEGKEGYSVSIALVSKQGISVVGVVYNPVTQVLYHAVKGEGLFRNSKVWVPKKVSTQLTLISDGSFLTDSRYGEFKKGLHVIAKRLGFTDVHVIHQGGAVMNAIWVLENRTALYVKLPKPTLGGGGLYCNGLFVQ